LKGDGLIELQVSQSGVKRLMNV